jgi:hypothetical protein
MATKQPDLHLPGWPEARLHGRAKTDGNIWWLEDRQADGSIKQQPLVPYEYVAAPPHS